MAALEQRLSVSSTERELVLQASFMLLNVCWSVKTSRYCLTPGNDGFVYILPSHGILFALSQSSASRCGSRNCWWGGERGSASNGGLRQSPCGVQGQCPWPGDQGTMPPEAADDILAIEWQIIQWKWDIIVQFLVYQHTPDVSQFQWHIGTKFQRLPPYFGVQKVNGSIGDTSRWNRKWEFQDGGRWTASTYSSGYRQGSNDIPRILHIFVVRQLNGT